MTLNNNFFFAFDNQLEERQQEILELERKLAELNEKLRDSKLLKQQYANVDGVAEKALEQLQNAIETINFAVHSIGTEAMGQAYMSEFNDNVDRLMSKLGDEPTQTYEFPMIEGSEEGQVENPNSPSPVEPEIIQTEVVALPSADLPPEINKMVDEMDSQPTDIKAWMKTNFGSDSKPTIAAVAKFYTQYNMNPFVRPDIYELSFAKLKSQCELLYDLDNAQLMAKTKKEYRIVNKAGFILLVLASQAISKSA